MTVSGSVLGLWFAAKGDPVLIRNALLISVADQDAFAWTPDSVPSDFLIETGEPPQQMGADASRILAESGARQRTWSTAVSLARHVVQNRQRPASSVGFSMETAYDQIIKDGAGYCSDYTRIYSGLANAAGIPVREWGMTFDGYGQEGHAFLEVFDRESREWRFIDPFYSFYVQDQDGRPTSAARLFDAIGSNSTGELTPIPIDPSKYFFRSSQQLFDYYQRGGDSRFLIWGNNVFEFDAHPLVSAAGGISKTVAQLTGIAFGVYPEIVVASNHVNKEGMLQIKIIRILLILVVASLFCAFMLGVCLFFRATKAKNRDLVGAPR